MSKAQINKGKVYLAGGGPGDPGLLPRRTLDLMSRVDVICYDALINPALLALAPEDADMEAVGYRGYNGGIVYGMHPRVIELANQGKSVLRLKAGDPFIFGRGTEECRDLNDHQIPFEIIPGITAGLGASVYAGFPLTSGGMASDVTLASGHMSSTALTSWESMGKGSGTLVLYMASKKIDKCVDRLVKNGRNPQTPVIHISAATSAEQVETEGTLETIAEKIAALNNENPAIIIVGEVVGLRSEMNWRAKLPMNQQRVLIAGRNLHTMQAALEDMGAISMSLPLWTPEYLIDSIRWKNICSEKVIAFADRQSACAFKRALPEFGLDIRKLAGIRLIACGEHSYNVLKEIGLTDTEQMSKSELPKDALLLHGPRSVGNHSKCLQVWQRKALKQRFRLERADKVYVDDRFSLEALCQLQEFDKIKGATWYTRHKTLIPLGEKYGLDFRYIKNAPQKEMAVEMSEN
ncbi:uroporphyrinogen-III C-methyltransferase [Pelagibaculum spongiae]|uniref:uroporphyrinogen-III C-methyltransferase n=1 Tax=Pelagibaculum spongiae TaxID=2080658 RepID=A0A2V1GVJ7_9GAMM|nr:uroporphyrinogen-III C-methyltransferase [Pelagibaculum spongiae]PVZ63933.1 uroporphyrinogen-III C-methyltransferase [Pelagibaculum spongiae]